MTRLKNVTFLSWNKLSVYVSLSLFLSVFLAVNIDSASFAATPEGAKTTNPSLNSTDKMKPNGVYIIEIFKDDTWMEVGSLSFDKYPREREIDLDQYLSNNGSVKIRLSQKGGGAAHIDSVFLGGLPPVEVKGLDDALTLKKLSKKDYDVINTFEKSIEFTFAAQGKNKTFSLTARVESIAISKTPLQFPIYNLYKPINKHSQFYRYQLNSEKGNLKLDGNLDEVSQQKPFFKEFYRTGSGHPSGFTYGWVRNDSENIYVAMDVTSDNTYDGDKDYAKVYLNTGAGLKEFKVSVPETKWGRPDFTYTDKVAYQHKVYEFKIPLKEVGIEQSERPEELQLAFAAYGTLAAEPPFINCGAVEGNPPSVDGVVSPGEWPNSPQLTIDSPIATKYYCVNDSVNLYILVDATGDETNGDIINSPSECDECLLVWGVDTETFLAEVWGATGMESLNTTFPLNGDARMGFGVTPNSATDHRFYEWKIPLASINALQGDFIDFSSPSLFKGVCGAGASMPYDGSTGRDNVWPLGVDIYNRETWGVLQLYAQCISPPSVMVSWWSGDGHAFDLIDDNDGTLQNGATYADGKVGKAFSFDGVNDYVLIPNGIIPSTARYFSVDAWVYANSINLGGENHIVYSGPSEGGEYYLANRNGNFEFAVYLSGSGWQRIGALAETSVWRHLTGVRRGTSIEIWVDGELKNSMSIPDENLVTGAAVHSSIGSYNRGQYGFWDGLIDEVEIFNRALDQTEIQDIYNARAAGKCKPCFDPPSDMVSWWTFDEGTGTTANDIIGTNDGTINGAAWDTGKVEGALNFNGVDDYVFIPDTLDIDGGAEATYDAWVFPESTPDVGYYYGIVGAGDSTQPFWTTQQCRVLFWTTADSPPDTGRFYFDCGTNDFDPSFIGKWTANNYQINTWYSVAGVFNNGSLDIYVNGVLDNGAVNSVNPGTIINTDAYNYVWIGAAVRNDQSFQGVHFDGLIDEVEIFNRALSSEEIVAIYAAGSAGKCKPGADLTVDKSDTPDPVTAGSNITYTVTIDNNGPNAATGVTLTDTLPAGITFVSAVSTQGTCNESGGTVTCDIGGMANGDTVTVTIVVTATVSPGTITNAAEVTCTSNDPDINNNTASEDTTVTPVYSVSGRVMTTFIKGGSPIAGVTMTLTGTAGATTTTDALGNYTFTGIPNGTYTVTPSRSGYTFTPTTRNVTVGGANVTGQNFTGTYTGRTGTVTYSISGTVSTPGGGPLAGVTMTLGGDAGAVTTTDALGNYTFTGLANGSYTVTPNLAGFTFMPTNRNVTVSGANVVGQDFTGTPAGGSTYSISGRVMTSFIKGGVPIPGVTMTLGGDAGAVTTTDALGNYTFTGLPNGSYTVTPNRAGYTFTPTNRNVTVGGANVTGQNFIGR